MYMTPAKISFSPAASWLTLTVELLEIYICIFFSICYAQQTTLCINNVHVPVKVIDKFKRDSLIEFIDGSVWWEPQEVGFCNPQIKDFCALTRK